MARPAASYRGARRNYALRELKTVWGPEYYYAKHRANYIRRTVLSRTPSRYHPIKEMRDYAKTMGAKMTAGARTFVSGMKKVVLTASMRKSGRGQ